RYTTMGPLGCTDRALASAAGALLAPRLDAAAADLGTGERGLGALAAVCQIVLDSCVHCGYVGLDAEHSGVELHLAGLLTGHIVNLKGSYVLFPPLLPFWSTSFSCYYCMLCTIPLLSA